MLLKVVNTNLTFTCYCCQNATLLLLLVSICSKCRAPCCSLLQPLLAIYCLLVPAIDALVKIMANNFPPNLDYTLMCGAPHFLATRSGLLFPLVVHVAHSATVPTSPLLSASQHCCLLAAPQRSIVSIFLWSGLADHCLVSPQRHLCGTAAPPSSHLLPQQHLVVPQHHLLTSSQRRPLVASSQQTRLIIS
jgi:hypothetical protein